jgi:putative dimethyl sulfoxide reductase chaperone
VDPLERAELYLCLARAFMRPADAQAFAALRHHLAEDLEALLGPLPEIAQYRQAVAAIADAEALARLYSKLFLAPPRLAHLSSSAYLDGAAFGASATALEQCYARCGLAPAEGFRSPPDHVSVQLEFAAYLYGCLAHGEAALPIQPGHFLHSFPQAWLPGFIADLERAQPKANPYLALALLLSAAVEADAVPMPAEPKQARRQQALQRARRKRAAQGITAEDLREIERRLKAKGLSTEHLAGREL